MSRSPSPAFGFALTAFFWAFGCRRDVPVEFVPQTGSVSVVQATVPELRFGVQPVVSARPLWERYDPLIEQLNAVTGATFRVRLESAQSFINYERKLRARALDVLIVDPHQVLEAERLDYRVFARSGNADRVSGVIVVRRDAGVNRVLDLQGKTICFGAAESFTSMLPRLFLRSAFDLDRDATVLYAGSDNSALLQALIGVAQAAGVSLHGWNEFAKGNPEWLDVLEAKWRTGALPGPAVMVHRRVPPAHVRLLVKALTDLNRSEEGRAAIARAGFSGFRYAESGSYDDVWEFVNAYRRAFRPERSR